MAVDSRDKRASALSRGGRVVYPNPSGTLDSYAQRAHMLGLYRLAEPLVIDSTGTVSITLQAVSELETTYYIDTSADIVVAASGSAALDTTTTTAADMVLAVDADAALAATLARSADIVLSVTADAALASTITSAASLAVALGAASDLLASQPPIIALIGGDGKIIATLAGLDGNTTALAGGDGLTVAALRGADSNVIALVGSDGKQIGAA